MTLDPRIVEHRKARAHGRLKATFVDKLGPKLEQFTKMMADTEDEDAVFAIADELGRLSATATALSLSQVADAINAAVLALSSSEEPREKVLQSILSKTGLKRRFAPIAIVAEGPLLVDLERQVSCVCESIILFSSLEELAAHPDRSGFQAEIIPVSTMEPVEDGRSVFVYGMNHDLNMRYRAREMGVTGYLSSPMRLTDALCAVRKFTYNSRKQKPRLVFLRVDESEATGLMAEAESRGIDCFNATEDYLFEILQDVKPDALVLSDEDELDVQRLVELLSISEETRDLAVIGTGRGDYLEKLEQAGVHWGLNLDHSFDVLVDTVLRRVKILHRMRANRDFWTGLLDRSEVLYGLDRELARARRSGQHVTAAIIEVLGVEEMNRLAGPLVGEAGFRSVAAFTQRALREFDQVGHLGGNTLLVILPGCLVGQAEARLRRIMERIAAFQTEIAEIAGMTTVMGLADTATSFSEILFDADQRLRDARDHLGKR